MVQDLFLLNISEGDVDVLISNTYTQKIYNYYLSFS